MTTEFNIKPTYYGKTDTEEYLELNISWKIPLNTGSIEKYNFEFRKSIRYKYHPQIEPFTIICKLDEIQEENSESKIIFRLEFFNDAYGKKISITSLSALITDLSLIADQKSLQTLEVTEDVAELTCNSEAFRSRFASGFELLAKFKQVKYTGTSTEAEIYDICNDFEKLFTVGYYSDIKLLFDNNLEIKAHKCVLSARSSFFQRVLKIEDVKEIRIKNVSYEIMRMAIKYMYCSQLKDQNLADAIKLLKAATLYEIPELVNKCEKIVLQQFEIKDMIFMLDLATALKLDNFKFNILSKCKENISKVTDEQISLLHEKHPEFARFIV